MSTSHADTNRVEPTGSLVNRLWSYCELLRHSGVSTLDYVEQLTYLLFLKMADERDKRPARFRRTSGQLEEGRLVPEGKDWPSLMTRSAEALVDHYEFVLRELAKKPGTMLSEVFLKAQNKIHEPAILERLMKDLINPYHWNRTDVDLKGDAYEGLLQRGAEDRKTGAGQYFTPRPLIDAIVDCIEPKLGESITDPACGTGGFLIATYAYLVEKYGDELFSDEGRRLQSGAITGQELVRETARLGLMNMLLHGIGSSDGKPLITVQDSLAKSPSKFFDVVLANPPFGVGSVTGEAYTARTDFWSATTNKQLNFVQHIVTLLKSRGRAAVVVPDNVLFEGGPGTEIRRQLLQSCNVHTLLRLPTGIFYANGVKANVLFFDKVPPRPDGTPGTSSVWVYDFRFDQHFTLKRKPLRREHLEDFVMSFHSGGTGGYSARQEGLRFKAFSYDEIVSRDKVNLDLKVGQDNSALSSAEPADVIAQDIVETLESALAEFASVAGALRATIQDAAS